MFTLSVNKKTGFRITDPYKPVVIRDFRGVMFYDTEPILPRATEFNLPPGKYMVDAGQFKELPTPVNYSLLKLPPFERYYKKPYNFKIIFGYNPNKCTIFWDKKIILFDDALKDLPLPQLDFIRFHEFSHARFKTEKYADLMAVNYMLTKGYNPIQIGESPILSLSSKQYLRKQFLVDKLSNYEKSRLRKKLRLFSVPKGC